MNGADGRLCSPSTASRRPPPRQVIDEEKAEKQARLEKEEKEANGVPCLACGSKWTATRLVELVENSRSETWGFKDAPQLWKTECFKCQHTHSFNDAI